MTRDNEIISVGLPAASSSIRRKLIAIIMGITSSALILSGVLIVASRVTAYRKAMSSSHMLHARMIANNCLAAVAFNDQKDALLVLRTLSSRPSLAYASVSKANGEVLAIYRREGFTEEPQTDPGPGQHAFTADWLVAQEPIVLDGEVIGTAFLQADLSEFTLFLRQIITIVGGSVLIVFIIIWGISWKLQKLISRPVERLTDIVRDISHRRDYSVRAGNFGRDEIGILAGAFNEMLAELQIRDERLQEREQRTQDYLNVAGVMIIALDTAGTVTLINPKGCEILGCEEKNIVGKDWFVNFIPERIRDSVKRVFDELLLGETPAVQYYENKVRTAGGEERIITWNNSVIRDKAGRVVCILSSGEDVTERRQAEEREFALRDQLSRAERMESIGVLAGGVAHDLNNILGPMVVLPELIEEDLDAAMHGDAAAHQELLNSLSVMKVSATRAASVVRDLVVLSRRGHYERKPLDLNKLSCFTSASSGIKRIGEHHPEVRIKIRTCSDVLMVHGSEEHLTRIVDNLVRNAAEAIEGKGTITITTCQKHLESSYSGYVTIPPGDYALLEVADTGSGIEPDHISRIFEPFYTRKKKTESSGSGLGLSIVNGIIEDHQGYIDVESRVGRGTTFTIYLPLTGSSGELAASQKAGSLIHGTGRILVVDDEPGQRFLASRSLTRLGYTVGTADSGQYAVKIFTEAKHAQKPSPFDLIVLDMIMEPGFDGLDALKEIMTLYPEQKVLIASGHAEDGRSIAAMDLGARWLAKPYSLSNLAKAVAELLQGSRA